MSVEIKNELRAAGIFGGTPPNVGVVQLHGFQSFTRTALGVYALELLEPAANNEHSVWCSAGLNEIRFVDGRLVAPSLLVVRSYNSAGAPADVVVLEVEVRRYPERGGPLALPPAPPIPTPGGGGANFLNITGLHTANSGASPTTVMDFDPGACESTTGPVITLGAAAPLNTAVAGAVNGLDVGPVVSNEWYASYLIGDSSGANPTGPLGSLNFTAPALPPGYDLLRRVHAFRIDGAAAILQYRQTGDAGRDRWTYWLDELEIETNGTAAPAFTDTTVNADTRVPPSATRQQVSGEVVKVGGGNDLARLEIVPDGWNEGAGGLFWTVNCGFSGANNPTARNTFEMPVGPLRGLRYRVQPLGDASADIRVNGWLDSLR